MICESEEACVDVMLLQLAGHDIIKAIDKEMSGDLKEGFMAIGMNSYFMITQADISDKCAFC